MPPYLNDGQTMLADTDRDFIADAAPVAHLRHPRDTDDPAGFDRGLGARFAEMGFTGMMVPERADGPGLGHVEAGVVPEEIGRNLSPSPFLTMAVAAVAALAGSAQGERWLPGTARGDVVAALAVQEAVQMHGGIGTTDAVDIGFFMKRARVLSEMFGDAGYHSDRIATLGGY